MDKRKRNSRKGKGKGKPNGGNRRSGNNRSSTRSSRVADQVPAPAQAGRKANPLIELLTLLREKPSTEGIKAIVEYVAEEHGDYYNLGKAVRGAMKRDLTTEEETLVKSLGANA